ncbi:MAG TPA: DUF4783 domain-containing protein [Bacteroidia bacterium]
MKRFLLGTVVLTLLFSFIPPVGDIAEDIAALFRTGNYKEIAKYFEANVDMKIIDQEDVYSKAQAELILKDFFAKHTPKSFSLVHNGLSKNGAKFAIGSLVTSAGTFKTYYLLKKTGELYTIQQLRIETEE